MDVKTDRFGTLANGTEVLRTTLTNSNGVEVSTIDFGAALQRVRMPDVYGAVGDVMLGYETLSNYLDNPHYFGVTVGRFANRIAEGRFTVDGDQFTVTRNYGKHQLHGGERGLSRVLWNSEPFQTDIAGGVILDYVSPDGDEGYPGELNIKVIYSLNEQNELLIEYFAESDRKTPINLTNHTYWNLDTPRQRDIREHLLTMQCSRYLETDDHLLPTGKILEVDNCLNFRSLRRVGEAMELCGGGLDHCYVIDDYSVSSNNQMRKAAELQATSSGRVMRVFTDAPAVQLYTGNAIQKEAGLDGVEYFQHAGLCLETQNYPDAVNQLIFPDPFIEPNTLYQSTTMYAFSFG
ncbi:MAG: aldose epimerase family protein [Desulforhopalus sp.]